MKKHEAGEFGGDGPIRPDRRAYEAKIAGLEGKVGQLTMELDLLKKGWPRHDGREARVPPS